MEWIFTYMNSGARLVKRVLINLLHWHSQLIKNFVQHNIPSHGYGQRAQHLIASSLNITFWLLAAIVLYNRNQVYVKTMSASSRRFRIRRPAHLLGCDARPMSTARVPN